MSGRVYQTWKTKKLKHTTREVKLKEKLDALFCKLQEKVTGESAEKKLIRQNGIINQMADLIFGPTDDGAVQ